MGSLLAVADPEGVVETATDHIGIELAAVGIVDLPLKGVTETVVGHAFQLGDGTPISVQSGNSIGVAKDLYPVDFDVELFFFRAPRFRAMLSEFLLEPFVDSFAFFKDHQDPRRHRFRLECGWKSLVGESADASPAVRKTEGVARMLLPDLDVVIDDPFDEHLIHTRMTKIVPTDRRGYSALVKA